MQKRDVRKWLSRSAAEEGSEEDLYGSDPDRPKASLVTMEGNGNSGSDSFPASGSASWEEELAAMSKSLRGSSIKQRRIALEEHTPKLLQRTATGLDDGPLGELHSPCPAHDSSADSSHRAALGAERLTQLLLAIYQASTIYQDGASRKKAHAAGCRILQILSPANDAAPPKSELGFKAFVGAIAKDSTGGSSATKAQLADWLAIALGCVLGLGSSLNIDRGAAAAKSSAPRREKGRQNGDPSQKASDTDGAARTEGRQPAESAKAVAQEIIGLLARAFNGAVADGKLKESTRNGLLVLLRRTIRVVSGHMSC